MSWTNAPAPYATGHLVTAAEWNGYVFDNPEYLKGRGGADVEFERSIMSDTDETDTSGSATKRWSEGHFDKLYASHSKYAVHRYIREVSIDWATLNPADQQWATGNAGNGDRNPGGTGQWVFKVQENSGDAYYIANQGEQNTGFDTSWNAGRSPYGRFEFATDGNDSWLSVWAGFRQTVGVAVPNAAAEKYAGLHFDGTNWNAEVADGTSETQSGNLTVAASQRHVLEVLIVSATNVLFFIDGLLVSTLATTLPTGNLDWTFLIISDGSGGAATWSNVTIGKLLFQEDLS